MQHALDLKKKKRPKTQNKPNADANHLSKRSCSVHLVKIILPTYFTILFIFATFYGSHYTFWYYLWVSLYYSSKLLSLSLFIVLSIKFFQFQQNKRIPNGPIISGNHFLKSFLSVIFIEYHCSSGLVIILLKKFENSSDKFDDFDNDQWINPMSSNARQKG